ncbi:hypothetical protein SLS53_001281 [Cytospora paraplurivora]|uniref:DUF7918 domain-containing protein n=1 Tax=Cytospora paraplurivora TaxID=2898453 RepID=A0AAN9UGT6_9PEZI
MAIIDDLGLEVKILVNGSVATEYVPNEETQADGDKYGPSTKICCRYIESINDAHFAIHGGLTSKHKVAGQWIRNSQNSACSFTFFVDGRKIDSALIHNIHNRHRNAAILEGVREANKLRRLRFASVSTEALQQELIIPRPRSLSMEPDVDNLSREELRRLARERLSQMRGDNKRAASVKGEKDEAPISSRHYKYVKIEGGKKAIDLTEDD